MKQLWIDPSITYDGTQLRSLYAYMEHGVEGDSIIAWRGPCHVSLEHMVDGEDKRVDAEIRGSDMIHFIVEIFDCKLITAVSLQRLMTSLVLDWLRQNSSVTDMTSKLRRDGDDIFVANRKLSISIATVSPVSALIHFAVNVDNAGTPVPTISLKDFAVSPSDFAQAILGLFSSEYESIRWATQKVAWVK